MDLLAVYVRRMNIVVAVILEIAQIKIGVRTESVLLRRILRNWLILSEQVNDKFKFVGLLPCKMAF